MSDLFSLLFHYHCRYRNRNEQDWGLETRKRTSPKKLLLGVLLPPTLGGPGRSESGCPVSDGPSTLGVELDVPLLSTVDIPVDL